MGPISTTRQPRVGPDERGDESLSADDDAAVEDADERDARPKKQRPPAHEPEQRREPEEPGVIPDERGDPDARE